MTNCMWVDTMRWMWVRVCVLSMTMAAFVVVVIVTSMLTITITIIVIPRDEWDGFTVSVIFMVIQPTVHLTKWMIAKGLPQIFEFGAVMLFDMFKSGVFDPHMVR